MVISRWEYTYTKHYEMKQRCKRKPALVWTVPHNLWWLTQISRYQIQVWPDTNIEDFAWSRFFLETRFFLLLCLSLSCPPAFNCPYGLWVHYANYSHQLLTHAPTHTPPFIKHLSQRLLTEIKDRNNGDWQVCSTAALFSLFWASLMCSSPVTCPLTWASKYPYNNIRQSSSNSPLLASMFPYSPLQYDLLCVFLHLFVLYTCLLAVVSAVLFLLPPSCCVLSLPLDLANMHFIEPN